MSDLAFLSTPKRRWGIKDDGRGRLERNEASVGVEVLVVKCGPEQVGRAPLLQRLCLGSWGKEGS